MLPQRVQHDPGFQNSCQEEEHHVCRNSSPVFKAVQGSLIIALYPRRYVLPELVTCHQFPNQFSESSACELGVEAGLVMNSADCTTTDVVVDLQYPQGLGEFHRYLFSLFVFWVSIDQLVHARVVVVTMSSIGPSGRLVVTIRVRVLVTVGWVVVLEPRYNPGVPADIAIAAVLVLASLGSPGLLLLVTSSSSLLLLLLLVDVLPPAQYPIHGFWFFS